MKTIDIEKQLEKIAQMKPKLLAEEKYEELVVLRDRELRLLSLLEEKLSVEEMGKKWGK
jgi:hypothetical protein